MIRVYLGNDTEKSRTLLSRAISDFTQSFPLGVISRFDADHAERGAILDSLSGESLFGGRSLIILDGLGEAAESSQILTDILPMAKESHNDIYIIENKPHKDVRAKIEAVVEKKNITQSDKVAQRENGGVFLLGDAFQEKNKKKLWMDYSRLLREKHAPEELHGILWWAAKNLYIAKNFSGFEAKRAGVGDYPYQKAHRMKDKWSDEEIRGLLGVLKDIVHDRGKGSGDVGLRIERMILSIKDK